jgi:DNA repair exonuclease SbcCD ATPase subunit
MMAKRSDRSEDGLFKDDLPPTASEVLRLASEPRTEGPADAKSEDRWATFWKLCGATLLSITALVLITVYNQFSSSINELRVSLNQTNLACAELVKNEEFKTRNTSIWNKIQELQTLNATITGLSERLKAAEDMHRHLQTNDKEVSAALQNGLANAKDRLSILDERVRSAESDHKLLLEVQVLANSTKEKVSNVEQTLRLLDHIQKELQNIHTSISNVQGAMAERKNIRDEQMKLADDDRKDLFKEVRSMSERLAKLEGALENRSKPSTSNKPAPPNKPALHDNDSD